MGVYDATDDVFYPQLHLSYAELLRHTTWIIEAHYADLHAQYLTAVAYSGI